MSDQTKLSDDAAVNAESPNNPIIGVPAKTLEYVIARLRANDEYEGAAELMELLRERANKLNSCVNEDSAND